MNYGAAMVRYLLGHFSGFTGSEGRGILKVSGSLTST